MPTAKPKSPWTTVSLHPLSGMLDTRSRPADIPPGAYRWKQNVAVTPDGKLCLRDGFQKAYSDFLYDDQGVSLRNPNHPGTGVFYHNHDHHHQGHDREAITFLFESTDSDGVRRLFDGTQSRISLLDVDPGSWTDIATGYGTGGSRWKAAELSDVVLFTNGYGQILAHDNETTANPSSTPGFIATTATLFDLTSVVHVSAAKVIIQFKGFILLMNFIQDGKRQLTRVRWCDLNLPKSWDPGTADTLAGFQDLPYGNEILGAALMQDAVLIYTRRGITRCTLAPPTSTNVFDFLEIYSEPENQAGCLVYPNTLVSTGTEHWYMSREAIYHFTPFLSEPERLDWLYRAAGVIFRKADTAISGVSCEAPIARFEPVTRELWFSWPGPGSGSNNWTFVAQIDQKTADVVDAGFMTFVNNRRNPITPAVCNENQDFLATSSVDWCIKSIGGVFYREFLTLAGNSLIADPPINSPPATYYTTGYTRILRGMIPTGLYDREKIIRAVLLDHDTSVQTPPCVVRCRVGNNYNMVDPNDTDDTCAVMWRDLGVRPLACPDGRSNSSLRAANLKPATGTEWRCYDQNRMLFFELIVENADGSPAIGGDSCLQRVDFDLCVMPKP